MRAERLHRLERGGYTGKVFEEDFVGSVKKDANYQSALFKLQRKTKKGEYVNFPDSLNLVKKFQPWDPANPGKEFARDLRIEVIDLLGIEDEKEMENMKFYTAVGTPLDFYHGVDAFLEYTDKEGKTHRITFDLSMNPAKQEGYKADIIVKELADPQGESKKYLEEVKEAAQEAAEMISEKPAGIVA